MEDKDRLAAVYVINLKAREDRKEWIQLTLRGVAGVLVQIFNAVDTNTQAGSNDHGNVASRFLNYQGECLTVFPNWHLRYDEICETHSRWMRTFRLEPVSAEELERFYGRGISHGEIGCFLSHRSVWAKALHHLRSKPQTRSAQFVVIMEDDVIPEGVIEVSNNSESNDREDEANMRKISLKHVRMKWQKTFDQLNDEIKALIQDRVDWDLIYLGRHRFAEDHPLPMTHISDAEGSKMTEDDCHHQNQGGKCTSTLKVAGFSSCLHAYALSRTGLEKLTSSPEIMNTVIPADEIIPGLCSGYHPRKDLNDHVVKILKSTGRFRALAFRQDKVHQLESVVRGDETLINDERKNDAGNIGRAYRLLPSQERNHDLLFSPGALARLSESNIFASPVASVRNHDDMSFKRSKGGNCNKFTERVQRLMTISSLASPLSSLKEIRIILPLICQYIRNHELQALASTSKSLRLLLLHDEGMWLRAYLSNTGAFDEGETVIDYKRSWRHTFMGISYNTEEQNNYEYKPAYNREEHQWGINSRENEQPPKRKRSHITDFKSCSSQFEPSSLPKTKRHRETNDNTKPKKREMNRGGIQKTSLLEKFSQNTLYNKLASSTDTLKRYFSSGSGQSDSQRIVRLGLRSLVVRRIIAQTREDGEDDNGDTSDSSQRKMMDGIPRLSFGEFVRGFDRKRNPVVLKGLTGQVPNGEDMWNLDYIVNAFKNESNVKMNGDSVVGLINRKPDGYLENIDDISCRPVGLANIVITNSHGTACIDARDVDDERNDEPDDHDNLGYIHAQMDIKIYVDEYMVHNRDIEPLYLFESRLPSVLRDQIHFPDILGQDYLELIGGESVEGQEKASEYCAVTEREWVVIGPQGSGSRFHVDPHMTSAFNTLHSGLKLWVFLRDTAKIPPGVDALMDPNKNNNKDFPPSVYAAPSVQVMLQKTFALVSQFHGR